MPLDNKNDRQPNLTCFVDQFPLAMAAVAKVHDYSRGPLLKTDYRPSLLRHLFAIGEHEDHAAAVAWNALAHLEMTLRRAAEQPLPSAAVDPETPCDTVTGRINLDTLRRAGMPAEWFRETLVMPSYWRR